MPILAHKIRLTPTPKQAMYFRNACGTARFAYNWALAEWQRQYKAGETPSMFALKKQFNAVKRQAFPWITDVTKCATVGVDVGIETFATLSNGLRFENPKATVKLQRRLARVNRAFGKKQKGSQNREKANMALARLHDRIACIRKDATHKLTDCLTKFYHTIVIEDLNVKGMMKNRKLAKHLADANFCEIHRQATYKAALSGGSVERVHRFYPSSKTCSQCGHLHKDLTLSDRVFACPACGHTQHRDENAAVNLMNSVRRASPELTLVD